MNIKTARPSARAPETVPDELEFERPFQTLRPETFYRFTRDYPKKEAVSTYVYRLLPKINRSLVGIKTNYIGIHIEPLDEMTLLQKYGSGMYLLKFTDSNQAKGLTQRATSKVELSDPDFPSSVDPRELVLDDEKSRPYLDDLRARGVLKGEQVAGATNDNPAVGALADMTKQLLDERGKQSQLSDQFTPILLAMLQRNPMEEAFKIAERLKPTESPFNTELLKLVMVQQRQEPKDPFENYERIETMMDRLAAKSGGGSKSGGWGEFLHAAPGLLQSGMNLLGMILAVRGNQPAPPTVPVQTSVQSPAPTEPMLPPGELDMMNPATIRVLQATGEKAIKAFERGIAGDHFASGLCVDEEGERTYDLLFALGKDGILQALSMVPGLTERLSPRRAEIEAWLESFISYASEESEVVAP